MTAELLKFKKKKPSKPKKIRYVRYRFSVSEAENKRILKVCQVENTTPTKLFKEAIREYIGKKQLQKKEEIAENQLNLFKNPKTVQMSIEDVK